MKLKTLMSFLHTLWPIVGHTHSLNIKVYLEFKCIINIYVSNLHY
jgi:hypothetical protein